MSKTIHTVLISGAGIAGPTLAFWLHRRGFQPTLVERAPSLRQGGYMIDFWGVGYDVAERMGLLPSLRSAGYEIREVRLVDRHGRRIVGFDSAAFGSAAGGRFLSILRGDLASAIYRLIDGQVETIFDESITEINPSEDEVIVRFKHGPPRKFDLVIGAGGMHSTVRRLVFGPDEQFSNYLGYCTASFTAAHYPHRDEGAYVSYTIPGRQLARYALRDGRSAFFFVLVQDRRSIVDHHDTSKQKEILRQAFIGAGWECAEILAALDRADDLYFDSVSQIHMDRWSRGRVALVGDAAFCPSLLAGQGSALAMAAAYVLAGELAAEEGHHRAAFRSYEAKLRAFIEDKQRSALRFGGWFAPRSSFGLLLRQEFTRLLSLPVVSKLILSRMLGDQFCLPEY